MEELSQEVVPGKEVECLTHRLQQHFRRGSLRRRGRHARRKLTAAPPRARRETAKGSAGNEVSKDARRKMLAQHVRRSRLHWNYRRRMVTLALACSDEGR